MKKLLLLICLCATFACKKGTNGELEGQTFLLRAATVSPAMMVNGKAVTNYMTMTGPGACLNYDYKITFSKDGTYAISSRGPLCERMANTAEQKWNKDGDKVTLTSPNVAPIVATLTGDRLTYTSSWSNAGVTYEVVYQFEND